MIVTAQKREQSMQDVPVAVTAFSAQQLEKSGVNAIMRGRMVSASKDASDGLLLLYRRMEVLLLEGSANENWPVKPASDFR